MDQNSMNMGQNNNNMPINNGPVFDNGMTTQNGVSPQVNEQVVSEPAMPQQNPSPVQTVAVNNDTLGSMVKFNIPQSTPDTGQPLPQPINPNENMQPTLGSIVSSIPAPEVNEIGSISSSQLESAGIQNNNVASEAVAPQPAISQQVTPQPLPPSEPEKKKGLSPLLKVLIFVLLTALGIGIGFVCYQMFGKGKVSTSDNTDTTVEEFLNNNVIENTSVELAVLNKVLNIVGVAPTRYISNNNILNYYVSNSNYQDYAKEIISYYANQNDLFTVLPEDVCEGTHCVTIAKDDVSKIFKIYNLGGNITDYFVTSVDGNDSLLKTDYSFEDEYLFPDRKDLEVPAFANGEEFDITHNITTSYDDITIKVIDTQTVSYYDNEELKTVDKTVTYEFRQDDTNEYYLYQVTSE